MTPTQTKIDKRKIEISRIIEIKSNIKAVGWMLILVFGFIFLYCVYTLGAGVLINLFNPSEFPADDPGVIEMNRITNLILNIYLAATLVSIFLIVAGKSILQYKLWGLYTFHAVSVLLVIGTITWIAYSSYESLEQSKRLQALPISEERIDTFRDVITKFHIIMSGSIGLVFAWLITRTNLLFRKKEYLEQFR